MPREGHGAVGRRCHGAGVPADRLSHASWPDRQRAVRRGRRRESRLDLIGSDRAVGPSALAVAFDRAHAGAMSRSSIGPDRSISVRECWALLRSQPYGRLAVLAADGPEVFPVNAVVDHGTLVFRTASGAKLDAMRDDPRVAFQIDGLDERADEAWSVVVRGTAHEVVGGHESVVAVELEVTPWQAGPKPTIVRVEPVAVTGRRFPRVSRADWRVDPPVQRRPSPDE